MKIMYKSGDMLIQNEIFKAHCCNDRGVFGAGIALQIRNQYPEAYNDYMEQYKNKNLVLGSVIYTITKNNFIICNCVAQHNYGYYGKYIDYDALEICLLHIDKIADGHDVAMPKIGAGLAGGDWKIISAIIENSFKISQPIVYIL
jgi:O-acetyl-ADP-ribose deacetylase (regulator of RNase III)